MLGYVTHLELYCLVIFNFLANPSCALNASYICIHFYVRIPSLILAHSQKKIESNLRIAIKYIKERPQSQLEPFFSVSFFTFAP